MSARGELPHHDFTVHKIFRTAETYKTNFQGIAPSYQAKVSGEPEAPLRARPAQ
jgi:hypothetical protein